MGADMCEITQIMNVWIFMLIASIKWTKILCLVHF